jgi:cell division protein FtsZ
VLQQGVRSITDLMVMPGLINLDFADVRSVMGEMGKAMMGTGEASGDNRAIEAAERAISNPLLDGVSMKGAKGVIISITGGDDMRLMEVDEAASHIKELVDPDANIIWGSAFNNNLEGKIRVSVVATGIEAAAVAAPEPAKVFAFPANKKDDVAPKMAATGSVASKLVVPKKADIVAEAMPATEAAPATAATAELNPDTVNTIAAPPAPAAGVTPASELAPKTESLAGAKSDAPAPKVEHRFTDELVLGAEELVEPVPEMPAVPSWLKPDSAAATDGPALTETAPAPRVAQGGGTLFERMSNIARGNAKADQDEAKADPLDIPRFLNRQNNQ